MFVNGSYFMKNFCVSFVKTRFKPELKDFT